MKAGAPVSSNAALFRLRKNNVGFWPHVRHDDREARERSYL